MEIESIWIKLRITGQLWMFSTISEYDDWNKVNLCGCCSKYLKMYPGQISEYFILAPIRKIELVDLVWLMIYYKYKNGI